MKNTLIFATLISTVAIAYALSQVNFFFALVNALGYFSIAAIMLCGFVFLEYFGYFDVFGYTFKKTYFVLSGKHKDLNEDDKDKMHSMFNYSQAKQEKRHQHPVGIYWFSLGLISITLILSLLYTSL